MDLLEDRETGLPRNPARPVDGQTTRDCVPPCSPRADRFRMTPALVDQQTDPRVDEAAPGGAGLRIHGRCRVGARSRGASQQDHIEFH